MLTKVEKHFLMLAIDDQDEGVAADYLWVARRCKQLARRNGELQRMHARARELDQQRVHGSTLDVGLDRPESWPPWFEPEQVRYMRRVAENETDRFRKQQYLRAVEEVKILSEKNRALRDALGRIRAEREHQHEWRDWLTAMRAETTRQSECSCCGNGCHTCPKCQSYMDKLPTTMRD